MRRRVTVVWFCGSVGPLCVPVLPPTYLVHMSQLWCYKVPCGYIQCVDFSEIVLFSSFGKICLQPLHSMLSQVLHGQNEQLALFNKQTEMPLSVSVYMYMYTRNELASLAHSFYTCLKHQLIHLTNIVLFRSIYIPWVHSCVVTFILRETLYR